jgi:mono/diheme cytochrome c family protein
LSRRSGGAALSLLVLLGVSGCWEQVDGGKWFPQMKRQPAVQAFEANPWLADPQGLTPPEGTVPIDGGEAPVSTSDDAAGDALVNPTDGGFLSLVNGRKQYEIFCAPCHGETGLADGPVAKSFLGVLPLVGVARARSDGHIYTTIRYGRRRMPAYARIPSEDRWDIVNYVRYLDQMGGRP